MSLAISNAKNVVIKNFSVIQPQFWASIIIESENVLIQDFYVNATSYNPSVCPRCVRGVADWLGYVW